MKTKEEIAAIKAIDLNELLTSGEKSIDLYAKMMVSTSALHDVVVDSMYLGHCFVYETEFVNCQFRNSTFKESEFKKCRFTNCLFENCRLQEQDFGHCTINGVRFEGCSLFETYFYKSVLDSAFFSQCESDTTMFKNCTIDGITITDVTFIPSRCGPIDERESKSPGLKFLESYVV